MKITLPLNLFFMLTISLCHLVHAMDCPSTVYVELGKDGIINCQISNNGDVYWYRGNSTKTSPIARLENGQKKLSQESNRYDIDEEGSLIIKNIEQQNYGFYSVVNFYANDKHDTDLIKVEIAVKPQTMCPIIAGCNDCDNCVLTESETGNISCSIGGTRPHLDLNIVTDSENWINVIRNSSEESYDPVTDTWSSTVTVQYSEWYDCSAQLHLRCVTKHGHPFELSDSVAHVKLDSCKTTTQISGHQTPLVEDTKRIYVFAIVITIAVIFVVILVVLAIVLCRKSGSSQNKETNGEGMKMQEQTKLLQKEKTSSDILKDAYKDLQVFTSIPNGGSISTKDVFQGINFTLTKANSSDCTTSSLEMIIDTLFGKERNFVFVDDGEFGRKAFVQYVCSGLCAKGLDQNIILYISLKGLDSNMTIAGAIHKQMHSSGEVYGEVSTDVIRNILETQNCLLLFDDVHELNQQYRDETQHSENQHSGEVTIKDVLSSSSLFQGYKKARSLCISNNKINVTSSFTERHVYIRIEPFSPANIKLYVASIFNCYQKLDDRKIDEDTVVTADEVKQDLSVVSTWENVEQNTTCVTDIILDEKNVIKEMDMCPSLIILFIHVLVSDIMKKEIDNLVFYINRRTYLTKLILTCLQYSSNQSVKVNFDDLMLKLGEASFEKSLQEMSFNDKCNLISSFKRTKLEEEINSTNFGTAMAMGLLKPVTYIDCSEDTSDNVSLTPADGVVEFRHIYIQEYFAAKAIAKNEMAEQKFVMSPALNIDERMKRILQCMYLTEHKKQYKMLKQFFDEKMWNILIDCLFEWDNDHHFEKIRSALSAFTAIKGKYSINIIDMDRQYHCMAVRRFCTDLTEHNVSLKALTFRKACHFENFCKLQIPKVQFIVFFEIDFQGEDTFLSFVKKMWQMKVTENIQFVKCTCPDKLTKEKMEDVLKEVSDESTLPKILRTDDVVSNAKDFLTLFDSTKWDELNPMSGSWEKI